ncbi:helix-turn-helix domain-containing protein [bacterium]|nr:helix-turn-helix domain-containing protein [bacterium]
MQPSQRQSRSISQLMTVQEVADYLHVSEKSFRHIMARGDGPSQYRLGPRTIRFLREDVETWLMDRANPKRRH